ncbi:MAG TPA: sulfate adenylyltransferase small subunit [Flavobacteriaceae bacterium]|nr:sulfate adenylyltransferase small subunit [Flavobacteriaceae bacterium]
MDVLNRLEEESIYIMREVGGQFDNPCLLFSGGKDSITMVRLAEKAFAPAKIPFPMVHIDTGHNFPETLAFRDELVERLGVQLIVGHVQDDIDAGLVREETGRYASRNALQTTTLLNTIEKHKFDACLGGARRDEEKARAKERIFSVRDDFGQWNEKLQRPEMFDMLNGKIHNGENVRVFPISNWTELDVWNYIQREQLDIPSLYYAHERKVFNRDGQWIPVSDYVHVDDFDEVRNANVRFRTVGDMTCTAAVLSDAFVLENIIQEIGDSDLSERGARIDDQRSEGAMEERKKVGYF